jgi:hypothetical protein
MTGTTVRSVAALLTVIVLVAACGPAAATPAAAMPLATLAPPSHSSATPTPVAERAGAPTLVALVLGGTWVTPKAGARLESYTTTLSARPRPPDLG